MQMASFPIICLCLRIWEVFTVRCTKIVSIVLQTVRPVFSWNFGLWNLFLPARRYASAGTSYGPVPVSVTSRCSIETDERLELVLAWELSSTYPTLCYNDIQVPPKTIISGTLLLTLDLENFATTYRSSKRVINLARERSTLRVWWTGQSSVN